MIPSSAARDQASEGKLTTQAALGGTQLFNRFTLQKVLGRGGMGIIWLARDDRLERLVALKLVPESVCWDPSAHEDLKRETQKSLMLTHPNIVRIFDFIEDERSAAISMEYVDGPTLSSMRIDKPSQCFEVEEIAPWVAACCDALSYAHESAKLVHRDLKPSNLMVNSQGELKITDFGIACTLRNSMTYVSGSAASGGTLNYMSPQQLLGEDPSPADDIYSLGATLYEMLSSKPPFFNGDVASQVREVVAPTITERRAKFGITGAPIPRYWEETIAGCLAKAAHQRPSTPNEIARRLRLGGAIRIRSEEQPTGVLSALSEILAKLDRRVSTSVAAVLVAGMTIGLLLGHHAKKSDATVVRRSAPTTGRAAYAMEKTSTAAIQTVPADSPTARSSPSSYVPPAPAADISSKKGAARLTTVPAGASYVVYPGVIATKTAAVAEPMRSGTTPESIDDLPPGHYTFFFHNDGWPDERIEASVNAGESVPVDYTFPHGTVTISSTPAGAEIFLGTKSLGNTPLTVDLPLGRLKLTARLPNLPERSQAVTIAAAAARVNFEMKVHRSRAKPTPTPSAFDKLGQSLKHVFGGKSIPRKRN